MRLNTALYVPIQDGRVMCSLWRENWVMGARQGALGLDWTLPRRG